MKTNLNGQTLWGSNELPDLGQVFHSCMGYASTPAWALIQREIINTFGSFEGLHVIELGSGLGKVSLLFSLLGAKTTLLDYSERQLCGAIFIHEQFHVHPNIISSNLLDLPENLCGQYDVAMSFGTAEHFWNADRQRVFDNHAKALKQGGLAILLVPNRYGLLFHLGRKVRKLLRRPICPVDERSFTRKELYSRGKNAGLTDLQIRGGDILRVDFSRFIVDIPRIFGLREQCPSFTDVNTARNALRQRMRMNLAKFKPWSDFFSYPLVFIGRRR